MVRARALGLAAFGAAAAGGAALGWLAERRVVGASSLDADPEWRELRRPVGGKPFSVVSADGTRLHAEVLGAEDAPTMVFAHGYGLSQHAWHYQRRDLAEDHRLVLYDQRGHGASDEAGEAGYRIEALGQDLAAVLDALVPRGERPMLVGHSMGGMSVLSFVEQLPERVADLGGVVLVDTAGSHVVSGGVIGTGAAALGLVESAVAGVAVRVLGRGSTGADRVTSTSSDLSWLLTRAIRLSRSASPAHVAFTEQLLLDCPNSVKAALGPMFASLDLAHTAALLTVPTLVIVGSQDRLTPLRAARRLADALPRGQLIVLPGVGHMAPLEAHEAVTAHLRLFAREAFAERSAVPSTARGPAGSAGRSA